MLSRQSRTLDTLHVFGICTSYYKYRRIWILKTIRYPVRLRRGICSNRAVNLGTQINSQNGSKATYDMVMILTQAGKPKPGLVDNTSAIPTIKGVPYFQTQN